jgi:transcriptional repressor NrdR
MENKVVDSRTNREGDLTRRRRECLNCGERFTTYERIERTPLLIVKQDGRREEFNRNKILSGVQKACQKRPVSVEQMENLVDGIERFFQEAGEKEISAVTIGEKVVKELYNLDSVAYVRFASVYRDFKDVNEFMAELKGIIKNKDN